MSCPEIGEGTEIGIEEERRTQEIPPFHYSFQFPKLTDGIRLLIWAIQMESQRRKECNGNYHYHNHNHPFLSEYDDLVLDRCVSNRRLSPPLPPSAFPPSLGYIQHPVSKMDTLAGIAIKYGVEVSDIRRMNGLVTDLQMFALKTLQIPLGARHPASDASTSSGNRTPDELFDSQHSLTMNSPQHKASPAGNSLQGFYRIKTMDKKTTSASPFQSPNLHRKSKSLVDMILSEIGEQHRSVPTTPETLLREDNRRSCGFPSRKGKGLALRQKSASRASLITDSEAKGSNSGPNGLEDMFRTNGTRGVKKSSSMSCLHDEGGSPTSIWSPSKRNLRSDFQAFASAKPIFDGLPKPTSGRRNKAALD